MSLSVAANATTPGTPPALVAARSTASTREYAPPAGLVGAWARAMAGRPTPNRPVATTFAAAVTISRPLRRSLMPGFSSAAPGNARGAGTADGYFDGLRSLV